jgi:hypothetical protein
MAGKNLQQGIGQQRKSTPLTYIPIDEKIPVEIRDIIRIKPQDFSALKNSLEEWSKQWD